jgi:hypothetical protein
METYSVGANVSVTFSLAGLAPTELKYRVRHQSGNVISGPVALALPAGNTITFEIAGSNNLIFNPVEARTVVLSVVNAHGTIELEQNYLVAKSRRLSLMENSFQTMAEALAEAAMIPNLPGWEGANDNARANAMIEAFLRLRRLGYRIRRTAPDFDVQALFDVSDIRTIEPSNWPLMTPEIWTSGRYPEEFRAAIRRAQIVEANEILRGDLVTQKRRAGIMSESIGESSMMFRMDRPLDLGISDAALRCLQGYVQIRITLARTS